MLGLNATYNAAVCAYLQAQTGTPVEITREVRLGGMAHDNWRLHVSGDLAAAAGTETFMLRAEVTPRIRASTLDVADEFALLRRLRDVGLEVPRALWLCEDRTVIGRAFALLDFAPGARDDSFGPERFARLVARIHGAAMSMRASNALPVAGAAQLVGELRAAAGRLHLFDPAYEVALRWLEQNLPRPVTGVLVHGDLHPANIISSDGADVTLIDWDSACLADPALEIGTLFSHMGTFGAGKWDTAAERAFLKAYETVMEVSIDSRAVLFWRIYAHVRQALVRLAAAARRDAGPAGSLLGDLHGRLAAEEELAFVTLIERAETLED
ncbi:MAG: phosphotransferase family protein [Anaerolineales bacterium]